MEEIAIFYYYFLLPLLLVILLKFYKSTFRRKNLPPSPRPSLPIIGHLRLLKLGDPVHRTFHNLAQIYGPIISLKFGSRLVVVVSSFSAAKECFTKNDIVLANRPHFIVGKHLAYNNTSLVQSPYGDHWRNLRRISTIEILSTHRLNMLLGIRKDEIKQLILKLASIPENTIELQSVSSGFAKVEVKKLLQELTFNIMMRMVAGKRYYGDDVADEEEARQFREIIKEAVRFGGASNPGDYLPILNWIDGGDFEKRVIKMAKRTDSFLQKLVDEGRWKRKELENTDNMIDHLLSLQESQPEYYTDEVIKGLVLNMLLAGTDTSAVTLEWAMSNLLNHPETLKTVKDEIDYYVGQEVLIDEPHISHLHYLQNIITETLRLYPAAPLLVPHMSSDDCTISGYTIPRDAILLVNAWAIHRDPKVWNDAASFKPERFEKIENEAHKMMPFGLGRRSCPGAGLAQRVVSLTLGSMIQCFEWEMVPGEKEIDMTEVRGGIVMHKHKALEATCRARPIVNKIFGTSS